MTRYLQLLVVALAAAALCLAYQPPKGPTPAHVTGTIFDQKKQPVAGVGVAIEGGSGNVAKVVTDGKGRYYKIVPRIAGKYRVTPGVGAYQFTPAFAEVSGSGGNANFKATPRK